jgi:chromosome partitioning protein
MIISLQNQKGGVGKTTLAIHLSHALSLRGFKILFIDADPQGSSRDWAAARDRPTPFEIERCDRPTLHREIAQMAKGYHHVIIDAPPRVTDIARSILVATDLVIIPIQPSPLDIWATHEITELIAEASVIKEKIKSVFMLNRIIGKTVIAAGVATALADYDIPLLTSRISQRVVYAEAFSSGMTVLDLGKSAETAIREIQQFTDEVLIHVNN